MENKIEILKEIQKLFDEMSDIDKNHLNSLLLKYKEEYAIDPLETIKKCLQEIIKQKAEDSTNNVNSSIGVSRSVGDDNAYDQVTGLDNKIQFFEGHHPIQDFDNVLRNLENASVEQISQQLDSFNGKPIIINGITHVPFNEPIIAARLNARYHELTGHDHPTFIEQAPKVIDSLMKDKEMLLEAGAYSPSYFNILQQINDEINQEPSLEGRIR